MDRYGSDPILSFQHTDVEYIKLLLHFYYFPSFSPLIYSLVSKIVSRVAYRANLSRQTGFNGLILAIAIAHLCIFVLSLSLLALFKLQGDAEEKEVLILLASLESEVQQHVLAIMAG